MTDETCCGACGYPVHATKESACDWCRQAADRIETLTKERDTAREYAGEVRIREKAAEDARIEAEAKLATCEKYRDAYAECDRVGTQAVRDLEAKLAKAVEALREIADPISLSQGNVNAEIACATLAQIKGESHE